MTLSAFCSHIVTANQIDLQASKPVLTSNIHPCYTNLRALPSSRSSLSSDKDDRVHPSSRAPRRLCIDCGGMYSPDQQIEMNELAKTSKFVSTA